MSTIAQHNKSLMFRLWGWPMALGLLATTLLVFFVLSLLTAKFALSFLTAKSVVSLHVNESSPAVFVDGVETTVAWQPSKEGAMGEIELTLGSHQIELRKIGFQSLEQTVNLDRSHNCILVLRLLPAVPKATEETASTLSAVTQVDHQPQDKPSTAKTADDSGKAKSVPSDTPSNTVTAISATPLATTAPVAPSDLQERFTRWQSDYAQRVRQAQGDNKAQMALFNKRRIELRELATDGEKASVKDHRTLARIYVDVQQWDKAGEHVAKALEAEPGELTLVGLQINVFVTLGDLAAADSALARAKQGITDVTLLSEPEFRIAQGRVSDLLRNERVGDAEQQFQSSEQKLAALREQFPTQKSKWDGIQRTLSGISQQLKAARRRFDLIGKPAIALTGAAWVNSPALAPEDLRGKVVLLDFWAVWCGPCIATFPHLREWHDEFQSQGFAVIGVTNYYQYAWDETGKYARRVENLSHEKEEEALQAFLKHHQLKHAIAIMSDSDFSAQYTVSGIPHAVVIDRAGKIRMMRVGSGQKNADDLKKCIRECLSESGDVGK